MYQARQIRDLEQSAIAGGIEGYTLMQNAGKAVFAQITKRWPQAKRLVVFCGSGNNAGDGYVVAGLAKLQGYWVECYSVIDPKQLRGDAQLAWSNAHQLGVLVKPFTAEASIEADLVVDAILGTGLQRLVQGSWQAAVEIINQFTCPVIAVDIPSGIQADTGQVMGVGVHADLTITFIGLKQGLFTGDAPDFTGEIVLDDLQVNTDKMPAAAQVLNREVLANITKITKRPKTAHKGHYGHVLVIGGNRGMGGAPVLAGIAALRSGAGLVSIAAYSDTGIAPAEIMRHVVKQAKQIDELVDRASVIVIGPGLGMDNWGCALFNRVIGQNKPMIIDADALNQLAGMSRFTGIKPLAPDSLCEQGKHWVLTPHPAEAGRLLACTTKEIQQDRFLAATRLRDRFGSVVVLKGAGTLVVAKQIAVCCQGNPGMASAGMGDTLSGIIAGLFTQGLSLSQAAQCGVWLHANAADQAANRYGEISLIASDLFEFIPQLLKNCAN